MRTYFVNFMAKILIGTFTQTLVKAFFFFFGNRSNTDLFS